MSVCKILSEASVRYFPGIDGTSTSNEIAEIFLKDISLFAFVFMDSNA